MKEQYNVLDFETTGLSADYDRVIEVGVIKVCNNKIVDRFESFINPGMRLPRVITDITGITNDMVKDASRSRVVMKELKSFVGDELIIAHNASFDSRFFKAEMTRAGYKPKNEFLCSLLLSRRIYQELSSHKLGNLCDHIGVVNKASHRALGDAQVTFKLFQHICKNVKMESTQKDITSDYLLELSKIPKKKVKDWLSRS